MKKETIYALVEKVSYKGKRSPGFFEAGFVKNSRHKINTVYLCISPDHLFEFTDDEALAIASILVGTVWQRSVPISRTKAQKLKWHKKNVKNETYFFKKAK